MKEELQKIIKGEVEDGEEALKKYSHDASVFEVRPQVVVFPKDSEDVQNLVKFVNKNNTEVKSKELYEKADLLSITCRCAGTDMSGGAIGESIILDFTRYMNKLINFQSSPEQQNSTALPASGLRHGQNFPIPASNSETFLVPASITVQPGMFYRDFEKITLEKELILPCYTASKELNAMGGMFGNNSAGERTLKYGKTEDYVIEAKVVFADGAERAIKAIPENEIGKQDEYSKKVYELIKNNQEEINLAKPKVHKNSAGYYLWNVLGRQPLQNFSRFTRQNPTGSDTDKNLATAGSQTLSSPTNLFNLNRLLVGSQGTLGIATEITFRLVKNPKYSKLVAIFMKDLEPLGRLVDEILVEAPETLETYDDKTMKLAVRFFPDFLKNKGLIGMLKFMWSFLPELKMMLTGGFPKMILLAEFAGENENEADIKCRKLVERIKNFKLKTHITRSEAEAGKYWDIRRQSFNLLRKHVAGKRTAPFIDDIIVRPEFLPRFIPELNNILSAYDITYTIAGHAGDGNFHIIPLMDFNMPDTAKTILDLSDKVYDLVLRYHGSITAEHNDGLIRTPYLEKMYGARIYELFRQVKNIFDPQDIFNPGKKIALPSSGPGTKEYIKNHLAIEHPKPHHGV